jgi:hypothetical protein
MTNDDILEIAVRDPQRLVVCGPVHALVHDADVAEAKRRKIFDVFAEKLVMIADDVDDAAALARLVQESAEDVDVLLRRSRQ